MRSIYLIIAFVTAAVFFFYVVGTFTFTQNFSKEDTPVPAPTQVKKQEPAVTATSAPKFVPPSFNGPVGEPHIIGPSGPPPRY